VTGKIDGKIARKPGDFDLSPPLEAEGLVEACKLFFRFRRRAMRKTTPSNDGSADILI
jgi:hypothetical protein